MGSLHRLVKPGMVLPTSWAGRPASRARRTTSSSRWPRPGRYAHTAATERAGLLRRLPGNVILSPDAADQAARTLAWLPQPFTAAEAERGLQTTWRL